jgi:DNA-binding GntR family transcriptional regulator
VDDGKVTALHANRGFRGLAAASTVDLVADRLREWIIASWLRRGQPLTVRDTARDFGAPQSLVRAAFARLREDGFLMRSARGTVVAPLCLEAQELFKRRLPLEVQLTRLATRRLTTFGLRLLDRIEEEMVEAQRRYDLPNAQRHNYRFHVALYRFADRPDLLAEVQTLWAGFPFDLMTIMPSRLPAVAREHEILLAALHAENPRSAGRAMHYHILNGWQEFQRHYPLQLDRQPRLARGC